MDGADYERVGLEEHAQDLEAIGLWGGSRTESDAPYLPLAYSNRLSFAVFGNNGQLLGASADFPELPQDLIDQAMSRIGRSDEMVSAVVEMCAHGTAIAFVARDQAPIRLLSGYIKKLISSSAANAVGLCISPLRADRAIEAGARAMGLTRGQSAIVAALTRHGDLRRAAQENRVTYATARSALSEAMDRAGVASRVLLVRRAVSLSLGLVPGKGEADRVEDVFGLSRRQAVLALAVAQGATRAEAAAAAGMSEALAKKEFANVFLQTGVSSATELAARITCAAALAALASATGAAAPMDATEPLGLFTRADGSLVAISDYGPPRGRPLLLLHSSSAGRAAPRVLVQVLQARGFRPIAVDRPGFGLTEPLANAGRDPFAAACADIDLVCEKLKLERLCVLARGGAQVAVHLAVRRPDLIERAVLAAPDPPTRLSTSGLGALKVIKSIYQRTPHLIEPMANLFVRRLSTEDMQAFVLRAVAESPVDVAIMRDPHHFSDYARGFLPFLSGRISGYLSEQLALATLPDPPSPPGSERFHILVGAHDPLHDAGEVVDYWTALLPGARAEILPDAGRYLIYSHAETVAAALAG